MRKHQRSAGFSLLEVLLSLVLLSLALLLAAGLMSEARGMMGAAVAGLRSPLPGRLAGQLRKDAQGAAQLLPASIGPLPFWTGEDLRFQPLGGGEPVSYSWQGRRLLRVSREPEAETPTTEVWLQTVESWRWRRVARRLVEIEVEYRVARPPTAGSTRLLADPAPTEMRREHLLLAVRGGGRGSGW